jgi:hypothetical protein
MHGSSVLFRLGLLYFFIFSLCCVQNDNIKVDIQVAGWGLGLD